MSEEPTVKTAAPPVAAIYLDPAHAIVFVTYEGETAGIDEYHLKADGMWCRGWLGFNDTPWSRGFTDYKGWRVVSREPLTLTPSIACRLCGSHGHITEGKWVPAA